MPKTKAAVPFSFWRREKKARVFSRPIISVRPIRKRIWKEFVVRGVFWEVGSERNGGEERTFPIASLF